MGEKLPEGRANDVEFTAKPILLGADPPMFQPQERPDRPADMGASRLRRPTDA